MDDKVTCPICLGLLYRPIVLPCAHEFCRECILNAVEHTSFQCPICRCRLSNWLRKVKDIDTAVDFNKENQLRDLFPDYYREKELGKSPVLSASEQRCLRSILNESSCPRDGIPANQGEVYSEYVKQMEKEAHLRAIEEKRNEEASLALAFQLLTEDEIIEGTHSSTSVNPFENNSAHISPPTDSNEMTRSSQANLKCPRLQSSSVKCGRTLLDYAVYKTSKRHETAQDQISRDAEFAQELQSEYHKATSPVITRSKGRSRPSRLRNK